MVILADEKRKAELIEIWKQSFGDSEDYIQMFFERNISEAMVMVYEVDEKAVSAAYFLPTSYQKPGEKPISCRYLYAAATLPEYRGNGYFGQIMKAVRETLPEPVFLVPGDASLVTYYEKQGMQVWQESQSLEVLFDAEMISTYMKGLSEITDVNGKEKIYIRDLDSTEYISKRKAALSNIIHIAWDEHFMEYICHENMFCGGAQKEISLNGQNYIIMYRVESDVLNILEVLRQKEALERKDIDVCARLLLKETGCKKAHVCLQPTVMMSDKSDLCQDKGYFNLTLG